jgi:RNA polymerase sigma-70 factor (ECF subfamily)
VTTVVDQELSDLEPYRRQLTAYCYRMLGSPQDAQDAVQDTLVRAWRGLGRFEDRAGLRPWLYRIATNVCLDMLKGRGRRALPMDMAPAGDGWGREPSLELALGATRPEATWVQPIPDHLVSSPGDPADVAVSKASIRLAFIAALQHLVPRQRAVLILRDVLSWRAHEVAELLETSEDAVNSTLRRARSVLEAVKLDAVPTEPTEADRELLYRYIEAFERYDVDSLVALLHEDATLNMPPYELWLQGIPDIRHFLAAIEVEGGRDRIIEITANGCPALAVYRPAGPSGALEPFEIHVLEIADGRIAAIPRLPRTGSIPGLRTPSDSRTDRRIGDSHPAGLGRAPFATAMTIDAGRSCPDPNPRRPNQSTSPTRWLSI